MGAKNRMEHAAFRLRTEARRAATEAHKSMAARGTIAEQTPSSAN